MSNTTQVTQDISQIATLVSLRLRKIGSTKVSRIDSRSYAGSNNMDQDSAVVSYRLFTNADLKPINSVCSSAKVVRDKYTLPWNDLGQRMLPNSVFKEFNTHMVQLEDEFNVAVMEMERRYPQILQDAESRLNGKFNRSHFPDRISERFEFKLEVSPMPTSEGLRINTLSDEELENLRTERDKETMEKIKKSATNVVERMMEALEILLNGTNGEGGLMNPDARFHQTSIDRVVDILDLAPSLNLLGNPQLDELVDKVKGFLKPENLNANEIRKSEQIRDQVKCDSIQAVCAIQDAMNGSF